MQNLLKNDIVWESIKEILYLPFLQKPTPIVQSYQKDPKAPVLSLVNQDLLYLKKGNSRSKKRENGSIVSITKPDYKNLNKNDIKDMYLLCINGKVGVKSYQQKVNLTTPTITFPSIKKYKMFSIISKPVYDIIYKNNKKEKRVMRHQEVHKFCDATIKRVLKELKSYNNDVKHGYVTPSLSKEDVEYLQLFEEETKERLKHPDQMRHWEMYVNERPLGSRREHPE
nr:hypothetical protein [Tanacetum cinerariifolium]